MSFGCGELASSVESSTGPSRGESDGELVPEAAPNGFSESVISGRVVDTVDILECKSMPFLYRVTCMYCILHTLKMDIAQINGYVVSKSIEIQASTRLC